MLYDGSYLDRLWCVVELATFVKSSSCEHVCFVPLWLPRWLVTTMCLDTCKEGVSKHKGVPDGKGVLIRILLFRVGNPQVAFASLLFSHPVHHRHRNSRHLHQIVL